ncbi:MAG TPA: PAS domain S-box protein, partial [Chthoniobacterales bacterium]
MSALLITLTGGRIETHFHVFGSLVFLSFYRDWRVLVPATIVVALDHFVRGVYWPYSVYGVLTASPLRSIEHAGWVIFEDFFLVLSCLRSVAEMRAIAKRTAALEASERSSRQIFEEAPIGMALVGLDLRFRKANARLCEMVGYSEEELCERTAGDIGYPADADTSEELSATTRDGATPSIDKRYLRKNGDELWATRTATAIRDEAGKPRDFLLMVEDISERKRAESALRTSQRQVEAAHHSTQLIMDNSQDVICTISERGQFVTVSAACEQLWGYKPAELIGRDYIDFVHPEDQARTEAVAAQLLAGEKVTDFVNRYVRKNGEIVDVLWSVSWSAIDQTVFCVAHDMTERSRIEQALREAKEEADRANMAKSEFLSRMSHELRTPLNAILGFGQLLERQSATDAQRNRVGYILSAGRHLLNLINEVLDISRIEAGNLQLSVEPVRVGDAVAEAVDLVRPFAAERTIELKTLTEADETCFVRGDRQRLKQVLLNLLSNAIKYTPVGGRVSVCYEAAADGMLRLSVADTGRGIPVDKLARLFTPFDRLGAEQSDVEGTGLGLALCRRLMEAMQGRIGVNSRTGDGSTFWIEIPLAESPLKRMESQLRDMAERGSALADEKRTLLYIEDNLSNLTLVEQMLADQPEIELISAMQGRLGFELALKHNPDLILLDLHLPDVPGWEVLEKLQRNLATCHIPVVVISADATKRQVDR